MVLSGLRRGSAPPRLALAFLALTALALTVGARAAASPLTDLNEFAARLDAAAVLVQAGQGDAAALHLDAARNQLLPELADTTDAAPALEAALGQAERAVGAGDAPSALQAATAAAQAADEASAGLADAAALQATLAELVRGAEHEGVEAADGGEAEALAYAAALARRSVKLAATAGAQQDVQRALATLADALAGTLEADTVRSTADAALAALGAGPAADDTERYFATIRSDLGAAADAYASGDADTAREKLIDAYLENFEYLEPALEKAAPDLKASLETTLRDDLRSMVASGADPAALRSAIEAALEQLDRAQGALE